MSVVFLYIVPFLVSIFCGFAGMRKAHSKYNALALIVMIAMCFYVTTKYAWFHVIGVVLVTVIGTNVYSVLKPIYYNNYKKSQNSK